MKSIGWSSRLLINRRSSKQANREEACFVPDEAPLFAETKSTKREKAVPVETFLFLSSVLCNVGLELRSRTGLGSPLLFSFFLLPIVHVSRPVVSLIFFI